MGIDIPASAFAPLAFVTLVSALSCTGLGLLSAGLGLIVRETAVLSNVLFGILLVCTGANVPLDALPDWLATVAQGLPFTHGIEAARLLADGASWGAVSGLVGREALIGAVYATAGYARDPNARATQPQARDLGARLGCFASVERCCGSSGSGGSST